MTISRRDAIWMTGAALAGLSLGHPGRAYGSQGWISGAGSKGKGPEGATANKTQQTPTLTQQLARFVVETGFDDLPVHVVEAWKTVVLDSLGVGFAGSRDRLGLAVNAVVRQLGGTPECTLINQSYRTDVARAAFVNGTMIGTPQSDSSSGAHAASNVVPAILAVAESKHLGGREFMAALALGAEVSGRIGQTSVGVERERGFHNPGVQGVFGSAAAVGKLLGFDEETMVHALGIAGSSSAGLQEFAWEGADMKATHAGRAAQLGLESALLAAEGVLGPSTVLEGPFGYFNAFSLPTDPERVVADLGVSSMIIPGHKHFAAHSSHQQVVDAILRFSAQHPFAPVDLQRVTIRGPASAMHPRHMALEPTTIMGGRYSLPFTAAVALTRDISDPLNYDDAALSDPVVRDLAKRIEFIPAEDAGDRALGGNAEVTLEIAGETHVLPTRAVRGTGSHPYQWEDGVEKFHRFTRRIISERQASELVDAVGHITELSDTAVLARATAAM